MIGYLCLTCYRSAQSSPGDPLFLSADTFCSQCGINTICGAFQQQEPAAPEAEDGTIVRPRCQLSVGDWHCGQLLATQPESSEDLVYCRDHRTEELRRIARIIRTVPAEYQRERMRLLKEETQRLQEREVELEKRHQEQVRRGEQEAAHPPLAAPHMPWKRWRTSEQELRHDLTIHEVDSLPANDGVHLITSELQRQADALISWGYASARRIRWRRRRRYEGFQRVVVA